MRRGPMSSERPPANSMDVGVLEALLADAGVHGEIDVFGGRLRAVVGGDFGFGLLFGLGFRVFLGRGQGG